jgi:hypothetical protein
MEAMIVRKITVVYFLWKLLRGGQLKFSVCKLEPSFIICEIEWVKVRWLVHCHYTGSYVALFSATEFDL